MIKLGCLVDPADTIQHSLGGRPPAVYLQLCPPNLRSPQLSPMRWMRTPTSVFSHL